MASLSSPTCPPGGAAQLTDLSTRWRRSAHRLVRQVAPFSSPTCPPGGAVQLTQLVLQVAPCRPRKSSARWRRANHTTRVLSLRRIVHRVMIWFVTSPAGTSTNQDERRVSFTTPVNAVPTVKASGKTARSSETPLFEGRQTYIG